MLTLSNLGILYRELCDTLMEKGKLEEGWNLLEEAERNMKGTQEESQLGLVRARLSVLRNDTNFALTILNQITPSQPHFTMVSPKCSH